jgi:hypothetical protein
MFCGYQCEYGLIDQYENPNQLNQFWYIKYVCIVQFSIKRLYIWPKVLEITFYHESNTSHNGDPKHGKYDLEWHTLKHVPSD